MTTLSRVSLHGHLEVVKLLVEKGADSNASDEDGRTALDMARESEQIEVVTYLESLK